MLIMVSISGVVENQPASTLSSSTVGITSLEGLKALTGTASNKGYSILQDGGNVETRIAGKFRAWSEARTATEQT